MESLDKRRINVRGIIWRDGKLLAVKHRSSNGGESDYWALPGGGLDPVESLEDGVRRELMEELGIEAKIGRLVLMQQFLSSRADRDEELEFLYLIDNPDDFINVDFHATTHGADELARVEWIDPGRELILPKFLSELDLADYIEIVKPVQNFTYFRKTR